MDTDSFIRHMKAKYIYKENAEDFEKRFDTFSYELARILL